MSSTTSVSDAHRRLHPSVQRWIAAPPRGWTSLRPAQAAAIDLVLAADRDVIVTAPTAGGKTEAAFFPICSRLVWDREHGTRCSSGGIEVVYVSPLKALINDQYERLQLLCSELDVPVHRWHGDVPASAKAQLRRSPDGIVVITPESLEALFVTSGHEVPRVLAGLRYLVVDELHVFIGTERGAQLQSLLHRAELAAGRQVPRIALSATLADLATARDFLRPGAGEDVLEVTPQADASMRLRLYGHQRRSPDAGHDGEQDSLQETSDVIDISHRLFHGLRGADHLVFANARSTVETYADRLAGLAEEQRVPNEFFPHHGNLSKAEREHVEERLKGPIPTTAICTSTLEMGIDIGSVDSVVQVGPPPGVASLRQRLGRSGRKNGRPVLTLHISEDELDGNNSPLDELRIRLVQSIAMVELMGERFLEQPDPAHPHLSTLIQQVLSMIAERGGASAGALYDDLCAQGPFRTVSQTMFVALLRSMADHELLIQASDGLLLAGERGDRMVNHYSFYTAFHTPEEYRLVHGPRTLGTIPVDRALQVNALLLFSGRRWRVTDIDTDSKVISLVPASGARPPKFGPGSGPLVADEVRQRMRQLYLSDHVPPWIDDPAAEMLAQGRLAFGRYELATTMMIDRGRETLLLPWRGDKILNTLAVVLRAEEVQIGQDRAALEVAGIDPSELRTLCGAIAAEPSPDAVLLAADVPVKQLDKHDRYIAEHLLARSYAARYLDVPSAWDTLRQAAEHEASGSVPSVSRGIQGQVDVPGSAPTS